MKRHALVLMLLLAVSFPSSAGVKEFVGLGHPNTSWDRDANWEPYGQPTLDDTVYLAFSPYAVISGTNCQAHTVVILRGGRLVVKKSDNGKQLIIGHDLVVEEGGTFNTAGNPGIHGPVVYIGGDAYNAGSWDLTGVSSGNGGIVFNGTGTQHIYGPNPITFQNLSNAPNDSLIISVAHVGVMGYTNPFDGIAVTLVDGATFNVGGPPLPITLARFEAVVVTGENLVRLSWRTLSEIDNYGFTVERSPEGTGTFEALGFIPSTGTGVQVRDYSFDDVSATPGRWSYRLRQTDLSGEGTLSEPVTVTVSVLAAVGGDETPLSTGLAQNYPNPFNPETMIRFSLPVSGMATVTVYDMTGARVAVLFDGPAQGGQQYTLRFSAGDLPTGSYFYRLSAGGRTEVRRMLLVR